MGVGVFDVILDGALEFSHAFEHAATPRRMRRAVTFPSQRSPNRLVEPWKFLMPVPGRAAANHFALQHIKRNLASGTQPRAPASFPYHPFGRKRSWKFALALRTCMIPLRIHRSSFRSGPGWSAGKCGTIFAHCLSLNQNKFASRDLASQPVDQALESKHG
jgi:hypothetical protein